MLTQRFAHTFHGPADAVQETEHPVMVLSPTATSPYNVEDTHAGGCTCCVGERRRRLIIPLGQILPRSCHHSLSVVASGACSFILAL